MSGNLPISQPNITAPTPQNTPLTQAPIAAGLSRPTVPDISEDKEPAEGEDDADAAIHTPGVQAAMASIVQGRLADLVGRSSGYIESLPVEVKRSLEGLKGLQVKQNQLHNQYKLECFELEKKYLALMKPHYERRQAVIDGKIQPTSEEIEAGEQQSLKDDDEYTPLPKDSTAAAAIPEFWLTALRNHIGISELITDRDVEALKHLKDVRLEYLPNNDPKAGFKILFIFTPNAYFENEVLEKTYLYSGDLGYMGDFMCDKAIGTDIKWKEDKDLTKEFEFKKQRNKNTNRTRMVRKARPVDSFFNFFNPPVPPSEEAIEQGEIDDDELEELEERLEMDYQFGEDLKERVIPRAVDYFTGKALEYDMMSEMESDINDDDIPSGEEESDSEGNILQSDADAANAEECKQQ